MRNVSPPFTGIFPATSVSPRITYWSGQTRWSNSGQATLGLVAARGTRLSDAIRGSGVSLWKDRMAKEREAANRRFQADEAAARGGSGDIRVLIGMLGSAGEPTDIARDKQLIVADAFGEDFESRRRSRGGGA